VAGAESGGNESGGAKVAPLKSPVFENSSLYADNLIFWFSVTDSHRSWKALEAFIPPKTLRVKHSLFTSQPLRNANRSSGWTSIKLYTTPNLFRSPLLLIIPSCIF